MGTTDDTGAARPIGFWVKLVDGLIDQRFAAILDEHGVTHRQWQLLNVLESGPSPLARLDAALAGYLDSAAGETSAEHLTELVESAWVVRGDGDVYEITERGRVAHQRLQEVVAGIREEVTAGVSPAEYEATVAVLRTAATNLGWTG